MNKKRFLFSLTLFLFSLIGFSCSQALPELKTSTCSVVFDYKEMEAYPTARLAVFVETTSNVRRVGELEVTSLDKDYVWEIDSPTKLDISGRQYAGNAYLIVPKGEKIPEGKYTLEVKEVDSDSTEVYFTLNYDSSIYNKKGSEIEEYVTGKSGKRYIMIYDSGKSLIYFGEAGAEYNDSRKIWNQYRSAATYSYVWITADKSVICVMPEQKVTPSS